VYPKETVVAEKFEAIVKLGIANTRMKDFYDLEVLARTFEFEGELLAKAIRTTFANRATELPSKGIPFAFTTEFHGDQNKKRQWTAFLRRDSEWRKCHRPPERRRSVETFPFPGCGGSPGANAVRDDKMETRRAVAVGYSETPSDDPAFLYRMLWYQSPAMGLAGQISG
jgi:Nucleotidyl transferase AbiEii toxin, Type IV TA system